MAYNIVLSFPQAFSSTVVTLPAVNDWSFDPNFPLTIDYILGAATPVPLDIATIIKNYVAALDPLVYSNISVSVVALWEISVPQWFVISGEIADAPGGEYVLTELNLEVTTTLTFQNLSLLTEGSYFKILVFRVTADSIYSVNRVQIDLLKKRVDLNVLNINAITVSPTNLNYSFIRDGALPATQDVTITTESDWTLVTAKEVVITGAGLTDLSTPENTIIQGSGTKVLTVGFGAILNDVVEDILITELALTTASGYSAAVGVQVSFFVVASFVFTPPSLSFFAVINLQEATPLDFTAFGFGAFTLTAPAWLTISAYAGDTVGVFTVTPIITANIAEGTYQDNIVLTAGGEDYLLPVTYIVAGTVYTDLDAGNFNFTKDIDYLTIYNVNLGVNPSYNNVVALTLELFFYAYNSFLESEKTLTYSLPFFSDKAQIHLGEIIERLMHKVLSPENFGITNLNTFFLTVLPVYKLPVVNASIAIINKVSEDEVFSATLSDMKFIAGKKPSDFGDNKGVLSNASAPKRITVKSKEIVNFVVDAGYYAIKLQKNDEDPVKVITQYTAGQNLFRYYLGFDQYLPGDVVKVIVTANNVDFNKKFIVVPGAVHSNHIAFVSQFKTLELFECTGSFTLESDIKSTEFKKYKDLVRQLEKIESEKTVILKINTGFIFKDNQLIVDEILRSKKAWLMFADKPYIEMAPKDKKLVNFDSDQELYEYELEFEINRNNDAETYTF